MGFCKIVIAFFGDEEGGREGGGGCHLYVRFFRNVV